MVFGEKIKTLAVFSHPNHEIAVYGIVCRTRPAIAYLTDGGGGARLVQTGKGLEAAGISSGVTYFNHTEESFYQAILRRDVAFFDQVASSLAEVILECSPDQILCDAVEYYNPIHDIALPVAFLAARKARSTVPLFAIPLVYQSSGAPERFVFQRALDGDRQFELIYQLQEPERSKKRLALADIYTALMAQMAFPPDVLERGCLEEHVVIAGSPLPVVDRSCVIRYDRRGQEAKKSGLVQDAITYEGHFLPLVKELVK